MIKKTLGLLLALAVLLAIALGVNTWRQGARQLPAQPLQPLTLDSDAAAQRLAEAVRLPTVSSRDDPDLNAEHFLALHALLEQQFPRVHASLEREVVNGLSLLYTWRGSQPEARPVLLAAHLDVVPVAPGTEGDWQHPPFAGAIADGHIWGRGAWDNKGNLLAQLEAIELLLAQGWQPQRTVYLAYGADEEVSGHRGAAHIARLLQQRGVQLDFVIDEGLLVLDGVMPGLKQPAALIGVAEKGYLSVQLQVTATPGHSSMPPRKGSSAIALLSAALTELEQHQMPAAIAGVAADMFDTLSPHMAGLQRVALSNLWLFRPLVQKQLEAAGSTNALLRTTTALTLLQAGNKENVLPGQAQATLNFRILPGQSQDDVLHHMQQRVARVVPDGQFSINALPGSKNPSKVVPMDSAQYRLLAQSIRDVFPDALVAPGLMVAATDSVHYEPISDHIFKFSPIRANGPDLPRFHGTNERLSVTGYADAIRFYHRLVTQLAEGA